MKLTPKRKYLLAFASVATLFLLNGVLLWLDRRYDRDFHSDPIYTTYVRMRDFILQPASVAAVALALAIWSALIYLRARRAPLTDRQKIVFMCIVLSVVGGYILTACFKL